MRVCECLMCLILSVSVFLNKNLYLIFQVQKQLFILIKLNIIEIKF